MMKLFVRGVLDRVFIVGLFTFLVLGSIIVIGQLYGVITGNGALTVGIAKSLGKTTFYVAAVVGLIGYVQSYLYGWKSGD
jgi:hypothetical protein